MELSERLKVIKSLVPNGARLLDIGSDHAFLPIALLKEGAISEAVVTDINKGPLERGRENFARLFPGAKVSFVLSDGFDKVGQGAADVASICGMGGLLISDILRRAGQKAEKMLLLLQPMSHQNELRRYLWSNGFSIEDELFAVEGDKAYVILKVRFCGTDTEFSYSDLYLGKHRPPTAEFKLYLKKQLVAAEKRLLGLRHRGDDTSQECALIDEIKKIGF